MSDLGIYSPFLKAKEAEFVAIARLSSSARSDMAPFFDIQKPEKRHSLQLHLQSVVDGISDCWGGDQTVFIDLLDLGVEARVETGEHPLSYVFRQFGSSLFPLAAVPVTGLLADRDEAYIEAVQDIAATDGRGIGLRLQRHAVDDPAETERGILGLLARLVILPRDVDLFLDFRSVVNDDVASLTRRSVRLLRVLFDRFKFRSVTVTCSNVPDSVADVVETWDSVAKVPRIEWRLWDLIRAGVPVEIRFGDYATVAPDFLGGAGGNQNINAKIRYSTPLNYVFLRGRPLFKPQKNFEQFYDLAAKLVEMEEFAGPDSSWGDGEIHACARRAVKHGNLTTWVQRTCNHHLEHPVQEARQRARVPAPV